MGHHLEAPLRLSARWRSCRGPVLGWDGPGLTGLPGAGLRLVSHLREESRLAVGSTSVAVRATAGQYWLAYSARLAAAFWSRSRMRPQARHTCVGSHSSSVAFTAPHPGQVLLEANHRSATIRVPPCQPAS